MKNKERIAILEAEISRLKVANRNNTYRIEQIESHLAEQHKGANFSKSNSSEIPNTCESIKPDFIPDWKDAPEWATCKAMDKSGIWNWYSGKPCIENGMNEWCVKSANDKYKLIPNHPASDKHWTETLEMRPDAVIELNKALHNLLVNHAPNTRSFAPDYTHLLPEGYEFCQEADAEKWVKVEMIPNLRQQHELKTCLTTAPWGTRNYYRPIRPIKYKVTTHEIVTAVPSAYSIEKHGDGWAIYQGSDSMHHGANLGQIHDHACAMLITDLLRLREMQMNEEATSIDPYIPDWSKAPDWATSHAFDVYGNGNWFGLYYDNRTDGDWNEINDPSNLTLPPDLDWKHSLRVKPSK
jgi:hypothetical protein